METIGFIGLGIMGAPMAGHLLDAGYTVVTSDHRKPPPADWSAKGLKTVDGHDAVAKAADIVITWCRTRRRWPTCCSARTASRPACRRASSSST